MQKDFNYMLHLSVKFWRTENADIFQHIKT